MGKRLSEAQIEAFRRDGFLFPLDLLSAAEARACRERLEAYEREIGASASTRLRVKAHLAFPWMVEIARKPALLDVIEDLIGPDIMLYMSALWAKDPGGPSFVSWHQDGAYYGFDRHDSVTAWVAFTDSTPETGCIRAIAGSHTGGILDHAETREANNLLSRGQSVTGIDESKAVDMALRAGQFSVHHEVTVHGSAPNRGTDRRIGMAFIFVSPAMRSVVGRRGTILLRGVDRYGHWALDPEPRFDLDPVAMAAMERAQADYRTAAGGTGG